MRIDVVAPSEPAHTILLVGQDRAGHWLVQADNGLLEGRFISREAAIGFARAERHAFPDAEVVIASQPLVSAIAFLPARADETVLARAA